MSDDQLSQQHNETYLAAAIKWVMLRLKRQIQQQESSSTGPTTHPGLLPSQPRPRRFPVPFNRQASTISTAPSEVPLLPASVPLTDEEVAEAAQELDRTTRVEPVPNFVWLSDQLGLSSFERDILLLCIAMELHTGIAHLCAQAQDDLSRPYPTFALALVLFDQPIWDALSPQRPLRYLRLLEINQPGSQPLTTSALRADERIVNYAKGLNYLDDRLDPLLYRLEMNQPEEKLPQSQQNVVDRIIASLNEYDYQNKRLPVIQLLGTDSSSKQLIARKVAGRLNRVLYRLMVSLLPSDAAELELLSRLWQRESMLLPLALFLDTNNDEGSSSPTERSLSSINYFLEHTGGILFLDTLDTWSGMVRASITVDVTKPTPLEQQKVWGELLGSGYAERVARLAAQFNLDLPTIAEIVEEARSDTLDRTAPSIDQLWQACLNHTRPKIDMLAQRIDPKATWDLLVLPEHETYLLRKIANQVGNRIKVYDEWGFRHRMNRGLGINALFIGESGTGKTMAAEVLANEFQLHLYRIDLSTVISKYIGETEKNLRRLFDAAEDGGAILFFDEADALFGKRSEVKDSHDRYANIEINYLLQRIEAYRGLAILATNLKSGMDTAFIRRLRFIVNFPFPGSAERKRIWQKAFPPETPAHELDYDVLARLNLTGGSIHTIALNAAFLAANADPPVVTMSIIREAAREEVRKLDRPINEADFRWETRTGAIV